MEAPVLALLANLENARRGEDYTLMSEVFKELTDAVPASSAEYNAVFSKANYELHMGEYQKAQHALKMSLRLAEESKSKATRAEDPVAELFALMNISGLILPALGRNKEAMEMSVEVGKKAESLALAATDEAVKSRALRIVVNAYVHQIRMHIGNGKGARPVERLLKKIKQSKFYQSNAADYAVAVKEAEDYIVFR